MKCFRGFDAYDDAYCALLDHVKYFNVVYIDESVKLCQNVNYVQRKSKISGNFESMSLNNLIFSIIYHVNVVLVIKIVTLRRRLMKFILQEEVAVICQ